MMIQTDGRNRNDFQAGLDVLRHTAAQRGDRHRAQYPLGLQVADDRGRCGAQCGGDRHHGGRVAGYRPAGQDEDRTADAPGHHAGQGPIERHAQRPAARQLGGGRVSLGEQVVAALPAENRHQQPKVHHPSGDDQDDERGSKDRRVEGW